MPTFADSLTAKKDPGAERIQQAFIDRDNGKISNAQYNAIKEQVYKDDAAAKTAIQNQSSNQPNDTPSTNQAEESAAQNETAAGNSNSDQNNSDRSPGESTGSVQDADQAQQEDAAGSDAGNSGSGVSSVGQRDSNNEDYSGQAGSAAETSGESSDAGNLGGNSDGATNQAEADAASNESASGQTGGGDYGAGSTTPIGGTEGDAAGSSSDPSQSSVGGGNEFGSNSASEAGMSRASGAATDELTGAISSLPGVSQVTAVLGKGGSIASLAKGLSATGIQQLAGKINFENAVNQAKSAGGFVGNITTIKDKIGDAGAYAKDLATAKAAMGDALSKDPQPTTVSVNGKVVTVMPPERPKDISTEALTGVKDKEKANDPRANADIKLKSLRRGLDSEDDDSGAPKDSPGKPKGSVEPFFGAIRDAGKGVIGGMEALMMNVPGGSILSKFQSALPPVFKSLLGVGVIAGLVKKGPISLGAVSQLVGGAALGAMAGTALRSASGGMGLGAVPGYTGLIGSQALSRTTGGVYGGGIPVNIARTYGNNILGNVAGNVAGNLSRDLLGTNAQTSSAISSIVGTVAKISLNKNVSGIPVSSQMMGLAANVALRSAGVNVGIGLPLNVLGMASASAAGAAVGGLVGGLIGGRVPVLPPNLSNLSSLGAMSGLTQNLNSFGLGMAETIIPRSQMQGLLPPNLQNQIRTVPERMTNGRINAAEDKLRSAPTKVSDEEGKPRVGTDPTIKAPMLTGRDGDGKIPYGKKISKLLTLGQVSNATGYSSYPIPEAGQKCGKYAFTADQIIENLSWLANNILDPIFEAWPGWVVTNGFRAPNGNNNWQGDHGRGCAADVQWLSHGGHEHHMKVMTWVKQNKLPVGQCIIEKQGRGEWCHFSGGPNSSSPKTASFQSNFGSTYGSGTMYSDIRRNPNG